MKTNQMGWIAAALAVVTLGNAQTVPCETESDRKPTLVTHGNVLIRNARVLTVSHGTLENTDVLVKNGKIAQIGRGIKVAANVAVVDGTGKVLAPGFVDAHVHRAADSTNEGSDSITDEVRILDVLNPKARNLWQAVASGETSGLILHGSANAIGGESLVAKFKYNRPSEELLVPGAPRMCKFALGENVTRSNSGGNTTRFPRSRMGVEAVYRRAFTEARAYIAEWDAYDKAKVSNPKTLPPRKDLRQETLADILRHKVWVQCHSYRADEILMLLRLSQEFNFKIGAFQHALEAYKVAPELAAAGIGVSTFADDWSFKLEGYDAIPYNATMLTRAGVVTSINTDGTGGTTAINVDAAKSMRFGGMNETDALKLVTINPAKELGIDSKVGSIDVGKDADVVLWSGHPLSVYAKVAMTFIEGEVYFQRRDAWGIDSRSYTRNVLEPASNHPTPEPPRSASTYAIVGGTVYPVSGAPITNGTVIMKDGKIVAVGKGLKAPKGAVVVNAKGMGVYPGFIDGGSTIGLSEVPTIGESVDERELGEYQPDMLALTALQSESAHINVTRMTGITSAVIRPGGGVVSGRAGMINLDGFTWEQHRLKSPLALTVNFPGSVGPAPFESALDEDGVDKRRYEDMGGPLMLRHELPNEWSDEKLPDPPKKDLPSELRPIADFFDKAIKYDKDRTASPSMKIDPKMEAMRPYVQGRETVFLSTRTASSIRSAVDFAQRYHLKVTLVGATEAWKEAKLLNANHIPVIIEPAGKSTLQANTPSQDWLPYDTPYVVAGLLEKAGVKFCFQSNDNAQSFGLPFCVGESCAFGLSREGAIRALTLGAAEVLGVSDKVGSLQVGKVGNLIIAEGDPLEPCGAIRYEFINGKPMRLESKFTRLRDEYLARLTPAQQAQVRK